MSIASDSEPDVDVLDTDAAGLAVVRGGAIRVVCYVVGALISAGGAALLYHKLGLVGVGHYVTIASIVAIVSGFSDLGLTAVGLRDSATLNPRQRSELFADLLGLRLTLTILGLLIALPIVSFGYRSMIVFGVLLAGIGLLAQTAQDNLSLVLQVELRLGSISILELLRQVLTVLGILLLVLAGAHLLAFVSVAIPVGAVLLVVAARMVRRQRSLRPKFSWRRWRPLLLRVLPYSAATAASVLYFRVAVVMVSQLSTTRQEGLFGASYRIIDFLTLVPSVLAGVALPIFSRAASNDPKRFVYGIGRVFEVGLIVGVGAALCIGIGSPFVLQVIGGAQYAGADGVLTIQGIGLGATFVGIVWANGLLSLGLYRQIMVLNIAALAGIVIVLALLIPDHGAKGAAVATALGEICGAVANGVLVMRRHPSLLRCLRVMPRVALAAALGAASLAIPGISPFERTIVAGLVYLIALLLVGAIPRELAVLLPRRFGV